MMILKNSNTKMNRSPNRNLARFKDAFVISYTKDVSVEKIMDQSLSRTSLHFGLNILEHHFDGFNECVKQSSDITDVPAQMADLHYWSVIVRSLAWLVRVELRYPKVPEESGSRI